MGSMNKAILVGRLGADPEVRSLNSGDKVASLRLATSESWKDKNGERKEATEWHQISIFGGAAEIAEKYLRKGSEVCIEGKLQTRKWQDKNGADRYTTEVVVRPMGGSVTLIGGPAEASHGGSHHEEKPRENFQRGGGGSDNAFSSGILNDDIPFIRMAGEFEV